MILWLQRKVVQLAATSQHVLVMYDKELEVWRLGSPAVEEAPTGTRLPLAVKPVMVARVVARTNGRFEAAALSDDGVWLSCTDAISSLLYHIEHVSAYVYSVAAGLTAVQKFKCC